MLGLSRGDSCCILGARSASNSRAISTETGFQYPTFPGCFGCWFQMPRNISGATVLWIASLAFFGRFLNPPFFLLLCRVLKVFTSGLSRSRPRSQPGGVGSLVGHIHPTRWANYPGVSSLLPRSSLAAGHQPAKKNLTRLQARVRG